MADLKKSRGDIGIIVYRANKFEIFASKFFPYHIPFISKRSRVKIKNFFKYRYKARLMNDLVSQLRKAYINNIPNTVETDWTDWEWEVISNDKKE